MNQSFKFKRDTTLVVGDTDFQYNLQTASSAFNIYPFAKSVHKVQVRHLRST